jgi:DNA (cytosine-5)-methyltransferase 3A
VSRYNYRDIVHHGDVTVADFTEYRGIDLLIGGSPCQSLSIVRALEEARPKWFLFENVASMNAESKAVISGLLGCDPVLIDSASFSAQSRPRLYWTNIPLGKIPGSSSLVLRDIMQPANEIPSKCWYDHPLEDVDMSKQICARMIHKNHEIHKRVFNPSFKCHTLTTCGGGNTQKKVMQDGRARKLTALEYERLQTLPHNYTAGISDSIRYTAIGNGWTVDVIAWILGGLALK